MRRALLLLPLALLGCVAQVSSSNALAGSQWQFTLIDGVSPASDKAALSFTADELNGTVGCNSLGGAWRIEEGRLISGPLRQTRMFCDGKVGQQEQDVSALLVSAPQLTLEGDRLTLQASGHSAEFKRVRAE